MTNRFYNNSINLTPFTKARASDVEQDLSAASVGFDLVQTELNAALRAPDGEVLGAVPAAASRASKTLAFDASGNPVAVVAANSTEMAAAVQAAIDAEAAAVSAEADAASVAASVNLISYLQVQAGVL